MSRTVRKSTNYKWKYHRSLSFASIKSHEHGRLDLLEHGFFKPHHTHKNVALDDYSVQSLKEIPSNLINEGKFYWDGDVWQRRNPNYRKKIKAWSQKRRINTKGAFSIRREDFEDPN